MGLQPMHSCFNKNKRDEEKEAKKEKKKAVKIQCDKIYKFMIIE